MNKTLQEEKKRVTIDTNIAIKIAISERPQTAPNKIMKALDEGKFISVTSDELLSELRVALGTLIPQEAADNFTADFEMSSEKVDLITDSSTIIPLVKDKTDMKVMQTAIDGNADFIVTDNIRDFSKKFLTRNGTIGEVIKPRKFLAILGIMPE
jgi:putative PIN family toxin of toxin-antitoxin system